MKTNTNSNKNTANHPKMGVLPRLSGLTASLFTAVLIVMSNSSSLMAATALFSVSGSHQSSGFEVATPYQHIAASVPGNVWNGTFFIPPVSGWYFLNVAYVKSALVTYPSSTWNDDVTVTIRHNGLTIIPTAPIPVGPGNAWSPAIAATAGTPATAVQSGTTTTSSVIVWLNANEQVGTYVSSTGNRARNLSRIEFNGFLIN